MTYLVIKPATDGLIRAIIHVSFDNICQGEAWDCYLFDDPLSTARVQFII